MPKPYNVFIVYARKDADYLEELRGHLRPMEHAGLLNVWCDREIDPGVKWEDAILRNMDTADMILLMVSAAYYNSSYIHNKELKYALMRHEKGEATMVPVIVRPCNFKVDPIVSSLQALPTDARPVTSWNSKDEAWLDVVHGIQKEVENREQGWPLSRSKSETMAPPKNQTHTRKLEKQSTTETDSHKYEDKDQERLDLAAWRRAKEQRTTKSFNVYLNSFPDGEFRELALSGLEQLEEEAISRKESYAWEVAVEKNTIAGYKKYLDQYPTGLNTVKAKSQIEELYIPDFMVLVKGGTFEMGSENGEPNQKPVHKVTLGNYYMGKFAVTVAEFKEFVSFTGYKTDSEKGDGSYIYENGSWNKKKGISWRNDNEGRTAQDNHPVIHVSWNDAKAYCDWLSQINRKSYRLPTEAEWEFAARGGNKSRGYDYSGSNNLSEVGWFGDNSGHKTHVVGEKKPNELGLYDMSGNVWEWCSDWFFDYPSGSGENKGANESRYHRVMRGGAWGNTSKYCRVAFRNRNTTAYRNYNLGFRLALTR